MIIVELKVAKTKEGILLSGSIPSELSSAASLEIFPLRDGAYLLTARGFLERKEGAGAEKKAGGKLFEKEKEVVRKLLAIRFEQRLPAEVAKALSKDERAVLDELMKKDVVQVFHGGKYAKTGVYNVSDAAFYAVREPASPVAGARVPEAALPASSNAHLEKSGWMVLETDLEARNFANSFPDKIKSGEVRGVRAFDRKFYFVSRGFVQEWERKVQLALGKSEKDEEEIAAEVGLAPGGCRALLYHLCETGEVMEKKKGKFARA